MKIDCLVTRHTVFMDSNGDVFDCTSDRKVKDSQLDNQEPEEEENLVMLLSQPSKMLKERSPGLLQSWGNTSGRNREGSISSKKSTGDLNNQNPFAKFSRVGLFSALLPPNPHRRPLATFRGPSFPAGRLLSVPLGVRDASGLVSQVIATKELDHPSVPNGIEVAGPVMAWQELSPGVPNKYRKLRSSFVMTLEFGSA
ncbi:hypothetical protein M514_21032 [Trichuris suis]|uniref:Uncharacterized protein n=1 Tax=Trichuris suis TaxID=68888 RepID=A0A085NBP2_9BILA|nr:hypothetical protein M514_21032 [Trichuris suis]